MAFLRRKISVSGIDWDYDDQAQRLEFSGTGPLPDYSRTKPWEPIGIGYCLVIRPGIESIGSCAFAGCDIVSVSIPSSVVSVEKDAFLGCTKLRTAEVPKDSEIDWETVFDTSITEISRV